MTKYLLDGNPISKLPSADSIEYSDLLNIDRHITVVLSDFVYDTYDYVIKSDINALSLDLKEVCVTNVIKRDNDKDKVIDISAILPMHIKDKNDFYLHFRSVDLDENPNRQKDQFRLSCYIRKSDGAYEYFDNSELKKIDLVDGTTIKFKRDGAQFTVLDVSHSDLSILTKQDLLIADAFEDVDSFDGQLSLELRINYKLTYETLVRNLLSTYIRKYHLSSMAYKDFWEYALRYHTHPYNRISVVPAFDSGIDIGKTLITYDDRIEEKTLFIPKLTYSYKIGELKFVADNTISSKAQIDATIANGTFDGWVYPDGSEYNKNQSGYDFTEAFNLYATPTNVTSFTVPCLSSFFRVNNDKDGLTSDLQLHNASKGLPSHTHQIAKTDEPEGILSTQLKIHQYKSGIITHGGKGRILSTLIHNGAPNANLVTKATENTNKKIHAEFLGPPEVTLNADNLSTSLNVDSTIDNIETHPSYNRLPVLVYIGNRRIQDNIDHE